MASFIELGYFVGFIVTAVSLLFFPHRIPLIGGMHVLVLTFLFSLLWPLTGLITLVLKITGRWDEFISWLEGFE